MLGKTVGKMVGEFVEVKVVGVEVGSLAARFRQVGSWRLHRLRNISSEAT